MALLEDLDKQGNFLFRWRSYVPGFFILLSFFYISDYIYPFGNYNYHLVYFLFCLSISFFGLFIRCYTIGHTPARTSGRNTKQQIADVVNQTGIYSLIRHPLYVGNFFMFLGAMFLVKNLLLTLVFALFYWFYYERIIYTEEMFLRTKFGEEYLKWANNTPTLIPNFKNFIEPGLNFSLKNVIKREYHGFFGIVVIFALYDVLIVFFNESVSKNYNEIASNIKIFDIYFLGIGAIIYIVVRLIVKTTKFLEVEGR